MQSMDSSGGSMRQGCQEQSLPCGVFPPAPLGSVAPPSSDWVEQVISALRMPLSLAVRDELSVHFESLASHFIASIKNDLRLHGHEDSLDDLVFKRACESLTSEPLRQRQAGSGGSISEPSRQSPPIRPQAQGPSSDASAPLGAPSGDRASYEIQCSPQQWQCDRASYQKIRRSSNASASHMRSRRSGVRSLSVVCASNLLSHRQESHHQLHSVSPVPEHYMTPGFSDASEALSSQQGCDSSVALSSHSKTKRMFATDSNDLSHSMAVSPIASHTRSQTNTDVLRQQMSKVIEDGDLHHGRSFLVDSTPGALALYFLRICGILPWSKKRKLPARLYQWIALLVHTFACVGIVANVVIERSPKRGSDYMWPAETCRPRGLVHDLAIAAGTIAGLFVLGVHQGTEQIVNCFKVLLEYAREEGLLELWARDVHFDVAVLVLVWLAAILERGRQEADCPEGHWRILTYVIVSSAFTGLNFLMLYGLRMLNVIVDTFCVNVVEVAEISDIMEHWKIVHAMVCLTSDVVGDCFFVVSAAGMTSMLLCAVDIMLVNDFEAHGIAALQQLVPGVLLLLEIVRLMFVGASVSDNCEQVPSLVNSLSFGRGTHQTRQYVVQYIFHSSAAFHVFGVRITSALTLKGFWLLVVVIFAVFTRI